ncbi:MULTISPECIES: hypothetical protein [unclassified Crossiella]|uniref:hypothetical protein n=1 Tax=unclassified Crossiella TaxID=2620835 RepID=UPI001FFEE752|nr:MULTISPECIES: hypothetical protein [unclassified Crossiella]MCK2237703.1 hypothetical protein [Crossiella sp. S99.2]MCK2254989.1 hypothetical protein [Crossiella sp. S99.1]
MAQSLTGLGAWATQHRVNSRAARYALGGLLATTNSTTLTWADGVLPGTNSGGLITDLQVLPDSPTPSLALRVLPGQCVISRPGQGPYLCTLDALGRITLDPADGANTRIDLVVARILDDRLGDPRTEFVIEPITGRPSGTPQAPDLPPGSIPLATVTVLPNATQVTAVTDRRRSTKTRGSIGTLLPGDTISQFGSTVGDSRYRAGHLEHWDGNGWRGGNRVDTWDSSINSVANQVGAAELARVNVSDPGWPYRLLVQASAELTTSLCRADLSIRLDSMSGPVIAVGVGPNDGWMWAQTQMRTSSIISGSRAVLLVGNRAFGTGTWNSATVNGALTVLRLPA